MMSSRNSQLGAPGEREEKPEVFYLTKINKRGEAPKQAKTLKPETTHQQTQSEAANMASLNRVFG